MPAKGWGSVSLPKDLISDVDAFLEKRKFTWTSRNEFVRHAVVDKLRREGFYKTEAQEPLRREEAHIDKDGNVSTSISKDNQHGSAGSQIEVIELERIEDLDESLDQAIIDHVPEADGCG